MTQPQLFLAINNLSCQAIDRYSHQSATTLKDITITIIVGHSVTLKDSTTATVNTTVQYSVKSNTISQYDIRHHPHCIDQTLLPPSMYRACNTDHSSEGKLCLR